MNWKLYSTYFLLFITLIACQEEEDFTDPAETAVVKTSDRSELSLDSLFFYAKEVYLWNENLPDYSAFSPRKYTKKSTELDNLKEELFAITQYSLNPATGRAYEFVSSAENFPKYSFVEENSKASGDLGVLAGMNMNELKGSASDFGFGLTSVAANDIRVRYVSSGSPAAIAGLSRGDKLLKVGSKSVRADSQSDINLINSSLNKDEFPLTVQKADGKTIEATLVKTSYTIDPVFKSTILKAGDKGVGYIAFSMFSSPGNSRSALEKAFAGFAAAGVNDLVVDLRYNSGGYVSTAEILCNQIAPSSLTGKTMYKEVYNELMQQGKASILKNQPLLNESNEPVIHQGRVATYADVDYSISGNTHNFKNEGALETVKNVYFIISDRTASASELVINALKPHLNVTLIGSNSYGKPVGFFGINIDKYTVYMSSFSTVNANGEGDYYSGFAPDVPAVDDVIHDFGDSRESSLSMALSLIEQGSAKAGARVATQGAKATDASRLELKHIGDDDKFKGMIENRVKTF